MKTVTYRDFVFPQPRVNVLSEVFDNLTVQLRSVGHVLKKFVYVVRDSQRVVQTLISANSGGPGLVYLYFPQPFIFKSLCNISSVEVHTILHGSGRKFLKIF